MIWLAGVYIFLLPLTVLSATIQKPYLNAFQNNTESLVYVNDTDVKKHSKQKAILSYVTEYLERGGNFNFVFESHLSPCTGKEDVMITVRADDTSNNCTVETQPPINGKATAIFYWGKKCKSVGDVIEQMLYALGFGREHLRSDRDNYVFASSSENINNILTTHTPYDVYSITHATATNNSYIPKDASLIPASPYSRTFLTPCDWSLLNTVYPGIKNPPKCVPNVVANDLGPALKFVKELGYSHANWVCLWANRGVFAINKCVRKYKGPDVALPYPNLHWIPGVAENTEDVGQIYFAPKPQDFSSLTSQSITYPNDCRDYCKNSVEQSIEQCIPRCAVCQQINIVPYLNDCVSFASNLNPTGTEVPIYEHYYLQRYSFQDAGQFHVIKFGPSSSSGCSVVCPQMIVCMLLMYYFLSCFLDHFF